MQGPSEGVEYLIVHTRTDSRKIFSDLSY